MAEKTSSILNDVKQLLDVDPSITDFDNQIMMHINSTFATLYQLGVGSKIFQITSKDDTWDDFTTNPELAGVKSYIWAKVAYMFDRPPTSFGLDALKGIINEFEFRLNVAGERIAEDEQLST